VVGTYVPTNPILSHNSIYAINWIQTAAFFVYATQGAAWLCIGRAGLHLFADPRSLSIYLCRLDQLYESHGGDDWRVYRLWQLSLFGATGELSSHNLEHALYAPQGGAFNYILINSGLVDSHVDFLSSKEWAKPSVIFATFWRGFPFWVITFLAALQNVPKEQYEAAAIDGASAWQRFRSVTIPGIRHVVLVVILLSTIWTTNSFENIWLMTQGGPSDETMTFPVLAYFGMQNLRIGEAAAVSVSMLPVFAMLGFIVAAMLQEED